MVYVCSVRDNILRQYPAQISPAILPHAELHNKEGHMHINVSRLHNAYMLRWSRTCTDTIALLQKLLCASPLLFASTFPRAMQGYSPCPGLAHVISAAPVCQPFFPTPPHSCKLLLGNARWRCAMPNELLVTSLSRGWLKPLEELQRHLHVP